MPCSRFHPPAMQQFWVVVPGMYGTHCKHCSLIPPLVSYNNLALLRCGYMCAGTLVHIFRHRGKTSNNTNKGCQLCIRSMLCHVCMYRILLRIFGFMIIILYLLTPGFTTRILFHQSHVLILSYHEYFLLISLVLHLLAYMLLLTTRFSMHDYV